MSEKPQNLLPKDGTAQYFLSFLPPDLADTYFQNLLQNIEWHHDETFIFGRHIVTKRKVAWYGDSPFEYTYSKTTKTALPWTEDLKLLKALAEKQTSESYNSCLLNLYHNGEEGMGWHTDNEKELKENGAIASLSFGAERKFSFKHKATKETVSLTLQHGSLLLMKDETQKHWLHSLPKTKKVSQARINLTFRTIQSR